MKREEIKAKRYYSLDRNRLEIKLLKKKEDWCGYIDRHCNDSIYYFNDIYSLSDNRKVLKDFAMTMKEERIDKLERQLKMLKELKI